MKCLFRIDLIESIGLIDLVWWIWLIPLTWPIDIANPLDLHVLNELIDSIHVISVIDAYGLPIVISIWCGWLRIYTTLICTKVEDALEPCTGPELHCSPGDKSASHWTTTATDLNHDGYELKPKSIRTWTKMATDLNHDGYRFEPKLLRTWTTMAMDVQMTCVYLYENLR